MFDKYNMSFRAKRSEVEEPLISAGSGGAERTGVTRLRATSALGSERSFTALRFVQDDIVFGFSNTPKSPRNDP